MEVTIIIIIITIITTIITIIIFLSQKWTNWVLSCNRVVVLFFGVEFWTYNFTSKIIFILLYNIRWELTERYKQTADEGRVSLIVGKVSLENTDFMAPYKYPKLFNLFQTEDFMESYDLCFRLGAFKNSLPFFFSKITNIFILEDCGQP